MITEVLIVAATLYAEAAGEPHAGRVMVCEVIANRAQESKQTPRQVVLAPYQFSCWNGRAGKRRMVALIRQKAAQDKDIVWAECVAMARVLCRPGYKPTTPVTHYHAKYAPAPSWTKGLNLAAVVGGHAFYEKIRQ